MHITHTNNHWQQDRRVRVGRRFVIEPYERGVLTRRGAVIDTLEPGAYRYFGRGYTLDRVDVRPFIHVIPTQEIPTADGVTVKLTIAVQAKVVDPVAHLIASQSSLAAVHLAVQVALREVVSATSVDDLVHARADLRTELRVRVGETRHLGIELDALEVKDVILPAELRRAQAEVLMARAEGQASLERARGEAAALRSLANSARLAADNPALLQLRLVQAVGAGSGNTVVIGGRPFDGVDG